MIPLAFSREIKYDNDRDGGASAVTGKERDQYDDIP